MILSTAGIFIICFGKFGVCIILNQVRLCISFIILGINIWTVRQYKQICGFINMTYKNRVRSS